MHPTMHPTMQALGVLLFVLSFGKLPFPGDSKLAILFGKYEVRLITPVVPLCMEASCLCCARV
jgi:hypothetical protein